MFNPGAEALLGYTEAELLGRRADMFHAPEEIARQAELLGVPATLADVSLASTDPALGPRDWRYVRKDGQIRTMSMTLAPMRDKTGTVVGYLSTAEDITERVRAQSALEAALQTERRAVAHLTEIDRTKDAFVSSVSHELRTPITNIVGYLELLLDGAYGETSDSQHEALGRIDANSHRLLELIDNLLTLSSLESLDVQLSKQPVDLREVIHRASQKVHTDATERGHQLDVEVPREPVVVLGDEVHLERMVSNLATNAVKFTPDGGRITLRLRAEGPHVRDRGAGHRRGHPRGGALPAVQPLLPHHPRPDRGRQRQRPGPLDRPQHRPPARRPDQCSIHARRRLDVHRHLRGAGVRRARAAVTRRRPRARIGNSGVRIRLFLPIGPGICPNVRY